MADGKKKPEEKVTPQGKQKAEQNQQYAQRKAEKWERLAKYSLDKDNKRMYDSRADDWRDKADVWEDEVERLQANAPKDKIQYYNPVAIDKTDTISLLKKEQQLTGAKVKSAKNNIYLSDGVKISRRELHTIDKNITKTLKKLRISNSKNLPKILIVDVFAMQSTAPAAYNPVDNILYINKIVGDRKALLALQQAQFACDKSELSTLIHEYLHWIDAEAFRKKFGSLTDFNKYIKYLNEKYKPILEKLRKNGYNIFGISKYASDMLREKRLDEFYTECRVK